MGGCKSESRLAGEVIGSPSLEEKCATATVTWNLFVRRFQLFSKPFQIYYGERA